MGNVRRTSVGRSARSAAVLVLAGCSAAIQPAREPLVLSEPAAVPVEPVPYFSPASAPPQDEAGVEVWLTALAAPGRRIVVSKERRRLWLVDGDQVLLSLPVGIGSGASFEHEGKRFSFETPTGRRSVLEKKLSPVWIPPDWHYLELAVERELQPVVLGPAARVPLDDGSTLEVRGTEVGRSEAGLGFTPLEPGDELIFDGKLFIPPFGTRQRQIDGELGSHGLALGDGYLIHGTADRGSVGRSASHGCIRMLDEDVARVYALVEPGTEVFIY